MLKLRQTADFMGLGFGEIFFGEAGIGALMRRWLRRTLLHFIFVEQPRVMNMTPLPTGQAGLQG